MSDEHPDECVEPQNGPLAGVTVVDMTQALSGPYATLLLAGMGARVIKVENPVGGDIARNNAPYVGEDGLKLVRTRPGDVSVPFLNRSRNKLSVTLDLKNPRGRALLGDLIAQADLVVENFSAGTADRLGVGYEFARERNPRVVYCSISGFGAAGGPAKAMDVIIQALSGIMMTSGEDGSAPVRVGLPIADLGASLYAVIGSLSALVQARSTGRGQHVDVSMLGALTSLVSCEDFDAMASMGLPARTGNSLPRLAPFGVFPVTDGFVAICAPSDAFATGLFQVMRRPELCGDPRFSSRDRRVENSTHLNAEIAAWTQERTAEEVVAALAAVGTPAARVRTASEAIRDVSVLARGDVVPLSHPENGRVADIFGTGIPIGFSGARAGFSRPAPGLGQDNAAVYEGLLGYPAGTTRSLADEGVI